MKEYFNKFLFFSLCSFIIGRELSMQSVNQIINNLIIDKDNLNNTISSINEINQFENLYFVELDPQGFVIISKEDRAMPVLGYSFNNSLDINNLPIQVENIINSYKLK